MLELARPAQRRASATRAGRVLVGGEADDRRGGERMCVQPHGRQPLHISLVAADDDADDGLRLWPGGARRRCHGHARRPQQGVRRAARARIGRRVPPFRPRCSPPTCSCPRPMCSGAYMPTFLPGTRLLPGFFKGPHRNVETYPSRWAFADYLSADVGKGHVAVYSVNPAPKADRAGRHRLRAPRRGRSLWWPVCLRDARLPDVGGAWKKLDEPMGQGARRRHGGAIARRLPRRQRHRRLSVARGQGRVQARQARPCAADQGRPLEGAARVQPVGAVPAAAAVTGARAPGCVPVGRVRRGASGLPAARSALGRSADFNDMAAYARGRWGSSSCRT